MLVLRHVYTDLRSYITGTVRKDRLPTAAMRFSNAKKAMPTRQCPKYSVKAFTSNDGIVSYYSWMDTAAVYFVSTKRHPHETTVMERQNPDGAGRNKVNAVSAASDYTSLYHGVDCVDQLTAGEYSIEGRGSGQRIMKWTVRMYYWFENLFAQMAYNIHDYHKRIGKLTRPRLHHGEFNRLIGEAFLNNDAYAAERTVKRRRIHHPVATPSRIRESLLLSPTATISNITTPSALQILQLPPVATHELLKADLTVDNGLNGAKRAARGACVHCPRTVVEVVARTGQVITDDSGTAQTNLNHRRKTSFYCKSSMCTRDEKYCWLHPECFSQYHVQHNMISLV